MQSLVFLAWFFQKLSKKNFFIGGGSALGKGRVKITDEGRGKKRKIRQHPV